MFHSQDDNKHHHHDDQALHIDDDEGFVQHWHADSGSSTLGLVTCFQPSLVALTTALFSAPAAFAGGGGDCHFHGYSPAKEAVVVGCAKEQINAWVANAKIEMSWKTAQLEKAETVEGKSMKEWKLTFQNPVALEANKKTLYLFFTLTGNFIAANFTGK